MEFWNDIATDRSWGVLLTLRKKFRFILIGGWACYLLTKTIKSKDIDIIVDFEALKAIRDEFYVKKTGFLRKYEALIEGGSVDIYVPYYSKFVIPAEEIAMNTVSVEGFFLPRPEILLMLKQQAELERKDSDRGQKDRVDILNLLLNSSVTVSPENYKKFTKNLPEYRRRLKEIILSAKKEFEYLGIRDPGKIKRVKKELAGKFGL